MDQSLSGRHPNRGCSSAEGGNEDEKATLIPLDSSTKALAIHQKRRATWVMAIVTGICSLPFVQLSSFDSCPALHDLLLLYKQRDHKSHPTFSSYSDLLHHRLMFFFRERTV